MKTTKFSKSAGLNKVGVLACLAGILLFAAPQVRADDDDTTKDPPKRVARISIVEGSVSLQPGGEGDWGSAAKNRPVTIGDKIWVDKDSRAELQAGEASFHVGSMTALSFLNLDEGITQVRIPEGAVNFRVRELRQGDLYEIDTPNAVFNVKQAGDFRIDVNEVGDSSRITVIRGEGEISAAGKTYEVHAGEQAEFNGPENDPNYSILRAPGPDGLDKWAEERDVKEDRSASGNYVSRDIPGYDDLDDHGTWSEEPEYGHVWYPNNVGPDWAPYSDGYWNYVGPWGWTWVGYEPWGFAPYHYGRWAYIGSRWGWCPGPYYGYPVYGPAFVGWLGGGWGFGLGFGVGWFPLGWGEPFFPWFGCSRSFVTVINVHNTFIRNVNVFNNRNFNFANSHNLRAVTTTSRNNFTNGGRINRGGQRITQASLNGARVTNSVGIHPTQHSSLGASNFNGHVARPSNAIQNRSVMARTAPAQAASRESVRTMSGATSAGRFAGAQVSGSARANGGVDGAARANGQVGNSGAHNNVRTSGQFENRPGNAPANSGNSGVTTRQRELSQNRPPSAMPNGNRSANSPAANNNSSQRPGNGRTWEAQGNATERGRAPQGFGGSNRPSDAPGQNSPRSMGDRPAQSGPSSTSPHARAMSDRPPWAGNGGPRASVGSSAPNSNGVRPNYSNGGRSYDNRGYAQQPSYSPRTYSAPSRSYPAPSRSYSPPPSRSYGGGGYSAPRNYGGGGGSYGAPRGYAGGGASPRSYGGGGGSPSYGGGGGSHSSGGYSGGGGHSSGGGGSSHSSGGGGGSHGGGGGHPHR
ncbi:MAG TPA: DUF6600 domain-containing protein [Candidatus Acidoferrum sp.]|nr:DUF6600 domain-containing protein [Candidatus Acidoferrum sp.]